MKHLTLILTVLLLSACSSTELEDRLEAERDFHAHQQYLEKLFKGECSETECEIY